MATAEDILCIILENDITVDIEKLDPSESLLQQGLDSLDMTSILFTIEEKFRIKISEEDIDRENLTTIDSIVFYINRVKNSQS